MAKKQPGAEALADWTLLRDPKWDELQALLERAHPPLAADEAEQRARDVTDATLAWYEANGWRF